MRPDAPSDHPSREPRETGYTASTPVPLYWARYGDPNGPPLLILHGGPGAHHDYLLPQMLVLGEQRDLVFYDQRGGGRSKADGPAPITWRTQVEDLGLVVGELGVEPLTILGYSWGGLLAVLYAIEATRNRSLPQPSRLVLVDPAPVTREYRRQFDAEMARRQATPAVRRLRDELAASGLRERDPGAYRRRTFELAVAGYFADPAGAHDLTPFRVTARVQQSVWDSLGDFDLRPDIGRVRLPALVVHGEADPIPLSSSADTARALGAQLVTIPASGHVPYVERPDALFPALRQFLDTTEGGVRRPP